MKCYGCYYSYCSDFSQVNDLYASKTLSDTEESSFFHLFRISGLDLCVWEYKTIVSALRMPRSVLTELHLVNNTFYSRDDEGAEILIDGLRNCQCKLKTLRLVKVLFFVMLFVIICFNENYFIIIL